MSKDQLKSSAQRYFCAVYTGDEPVVDALAGDDIATSYPIFEKLFNTPVLHGRKAIKEFAARFNQHWDQAQITFHETICEGALVVLVWGFQARSIASDEDHAWGGITLIRFDASGKIVAEIGEESEPGPWARLVSDPVESA